MKTERLYAITLYLLNHGRTSAGELADHFEVSRRTIQRDIDSLCLSGIPVISLSGATGGYEISPRYQLDHQFATSGDYTCILTALRGLISATGDRKAQATLEKIAHVFPQSRQDLILDFSVLREGDTRILQTLQDAIAGKHVVRFTYTNNNNETRSHTAEPIAVIYRWYAWYLLAFSRAREDYRTYKLVRMSTLEITDLTFTKEHPAAHLVLEQSEKKDSRKYLDILVKCTPQARMRAIEYLKGTILKEYENGDTLMRLTVVENEHLWFGTLLSLGSNAEILEPLWLRTHILSAAKELVSLYGKCQNAPFQKDSPNLKQR